MYFAIIFFLFSVYHVNIKIIKRLKIPHAGTNESLVKKAYL